MAASHRQRAAPAVSTRNPSHWGSSTNHNMKNATPVASEASTGGHRLLPIAADSWLAMNVPMVVFGMIFPRKERIRGPNTVGIRWDEMPVGFGGGKPLSAQAPSNCTLGARRESRLTVGTSKEPTTAGSCQVTAFA